MKVSVKDVGLFLLGTGFFILSILALHFYITQVLPHTLSPRFSAFCQQSNSFYLAYINNYGNVPLENVVIEVNGQPLCTYNKIPPDGSVVCKLPLETEMFEVKAKAGEQTITKAVPCQRTVLD